MDTTHIDRSIAIRDIMAEQRPDVISFAYVAVDSSWRVYWGANYEQSASIVMADKLEHMARNSHKFKDI
jgi:hypothetical protein